MRSAANGAVGTASGTTAAAVGGDSACAAALAWLSACGTALACDSACGTSVRCLNASSFLRAAPALAALRSQAAMAAIITANGLPARLIAKAHRRHATRPLRSVSLRGFGSAEADVLCGRVECAPVGGGAISTQAWLECAIALVDLPEVLGCVGTPHRRQVLQRLEPLQSQCHHCWPSE